MHYKSTQFDLNARKKQFVQEASMLQSKLVFGPLNSGIAGITLDGAEFIFTHKDLDESGDVVGWHFRSTMGATAVDPRFTNTSVLIIND